MQNKYLKYFLILIIVAFIIPQIAFAAWWNPFTWNWNIFDWFSKPQTSIVQPIQHTATPTQPSITSLYKTDFDGGTLYANLYRSDDAGNTWKKILSAYKSSIVYATVSQNPNIIYAGDTSCNTMADTSKMCADIFKSSDKGETWTSISKGIMNQVGVLNGVSSVKIDPKSSNTVTVTVTSASTGNNNVNFQSADGGNTWVESNPGQASITVAGMQKYTDSNFGFSFWYPNTGSVQVIPTDAKQPGIDVNAYSGILYGANTKILKTIQAPEFTINEVYSPNMSILSSVDAGPGGSNYDKYFFDPQTHTWMYASDGGPAQITHGGTTAADVSNNTMGGLHIFQGYTRFGIKNIIPLSAQNFLVFYSKCSDATDYLCSQGSGKDKFNKSVQTIVATDPSVATPVSATLQTQAVQAEANAYAGQ